MANATINFPVDEINQILSVAEADKNQGFLDASDFATNPLGNPDYTTLLTEDGYYMIISTSQTIADGGGLNVNDVRVEAPVGSYVVRSESGFSIFNSESPTFPGLPDGSMVQVVDGVLTTAPMRVLSDSILAEQELASEANSIRVGTAVVMSELGGLVLTDSRVTNNRYLGVYSKVDGSGGGVTTDKPFRFKFEDEIDQSEGSVENPPVQPIFTTPMPNITTIDIVGIDELHKLNKIRMRFDGAVNNVSARVTYTDNGNIIKYFPSERAWIDAGDGDYSNGADFLDGLQEVYPANQPGGTPMIFPPSSSIRMEFRSDEQIDLLGDGTTPYIEISYEPSSLVNIAEQSEIITLTSDTTIGSVNFEEYRNNVILFNQDSASDVTLTVTDGLLEDNDELTLLFYPVGIANEGQLIIQMGNTGSINGSNSLTVLRDSSITIKHLSGDDYYIVETSEHPLTIRRDSPTISMMTALTQASVNNNSALWILANNQIQANEEIIDPTIQVIALRDDLLDQNGNPIPTVLTQKRLVLLEGGTICRIISPTEIRVVTTPQMSSTGLRTNSLTVDTTINSDSVSAYRNDLLLFTNSSGVVTLTITDDIFDEDNEIIVKHFSSNPNMSIGVNVVQEGVGADIEGQANLQLRNNTSARLKYIGSNKWRILSSHNMGGSTPVPITPEAHAFSIDIPSRVDVNENPDTVNTSHNLSYSVTNHSLITSSVLHIGGSAFVLPLPTIDGVNIATVNITSIDLSSAQNYDMYIELNMDTTLRSNIQVLRVANLPQQEAVYFGTMETNVPATIDINTLTLMEVSQNITFDADFEIPNTNWAVILSPSNYTISSILDKTLNQEILSSFTETENVRTIGTQSYNSYVLQSNAGITATLSTSISMEV